MRATGTPRRLQPSRWLSGAIAGLTLGFGLVALLTVRSAHAADAKPVFRAGAATSNISPPLGTSINGNMHDHPVAHIHDELHARALVLDDGKTQLALVVCDNCMIPREVITEAKKLIQDRSKLAPDHVLISATHAHSCPTAGSVFQSDPDPAYLKFLAVRIADAVQRALNNREPASIGWGAGKNADQVFNRRWKMKPGTVPANPFGHTTDRAKMNPGVGSPNLVEPAGPTDPEVPVVSVRSASGRPIALLANYSLHYVGGVGAGHASADYYGAFADRTKQLIEGDRLDPPFVAMMSNGTSGDINNIDFRKARKPAKPYERIRLVADELATEAVRVARAIEYRNELTLDARAADLKLGVRRPNPTELAEAEAILARAKPGPDLKSINEIYARESVLLSKYPEMVDVNVQALRIGDLAIVAIPCEVFVEIGLKLKAESPIKPTFTIELANGYNGYLPTKEQHELGGYETWRARSSYLEVDAASKITAKALDLLQELAKARPAH